MLIEPYPAWSQKRAAPGRLVGGQKLAGEGERRCTGSGGPVVTDGAYIESKDVIGGTFIVKAVSYYDAVKRLADCLHLRRAT